jgi:hypothetical protein
VSSNNDNVFVYTVVRPWHILIPHSRGRQDVEKRKNREHIGKLNNDNDQTSQSNTGRNTIQ